MALLTATRGDTLERTFIWEDANDDPINIADYEIVLAVTFNRTTTVYEVGNGISVVPDQGRIEIKIEGEDTASWPGRGSFQLTMISPDAPPITTTIRRGTIRVE